LKVVALSGGTGSAKLLRGLSRLKIDLTVVANVGDNFWKYGVYVCPDIDIATYTLAGVADPDKGWGIRRDSFNVLEQLTRLGEETWFRLGDKDLATCLWRTELLQKGASLTRATLLICDSYGVKEKVLPACDDHIETRIITEKGDIHLQEYWVKERGRPVVTGVRYRGAIRARLTKEVARAISDADRIIVCPANPVTSIGPMLALPGFRTLLRGSGARIVALSPMVGESPFSGPAGSLMKAVGESPSSRGVAKLYGGFLDSIVIPDSDAYMRPGIEGLGIRCVTTDTLIRGPEDEHRLAKEMLRA